MDVASETEDRFLKYDIIPVECIHLLIGLECYVKADDTQIKDFLTHYIAHYFSALGLQKAQNGLIKMQTETKKILENKMTQEEENLKEYWTNIQLLNNTVNLIFNVFKDSYSREAKHQAKWEEICNKKEYASSEEFLEKVGIDEKTNEIIRRGKSIWFDAHIKALFIDIYPDLGPIPLRIDRNGPYFGFFSFLNEKTGYNSIDIEKGMLLKKYKRSLK